MNDRFRDLDDAADEAEKAADEALAARLEEIRTLSSTDLEALKPQIEMEDAEKFEELMSAVQASTQQNETLATFRERVKSLAQDGGAFLERVGKLAKNLRPGL